MDAIKKELEKLKAMLEMDNEQYYIERAAEDEFTRKYLKESDMYPYKCGVTITTIDYILALIEKGVKGC